MARQLLVIMQAAFSSGWGGSTSRLFDIAHGSGRYGWTTTLLAHKNHLPSAPSGPASEFPGQVLIATNQSLWLNWEGVKRLYYRAFDRHGANLDPLRCWGSRIPSWYLSSPYFSKPDVVWAVSTGSMEGAIAARSLASSLDCPWVLEFHDPCPPPNTTLNRFQEQSLRECLESCAAVVTVTQSFADHLISQHSCCQGKTVAVHFSFDETIPRIQHPRGREAPLLLLQVGALSRAPSYARSNARNLVHALGAAFHADPTSLGRMHLRFLGGRAGGEEGVACARELGITEAVSSHPQVPVSECFAAMDGADVLLVVEAPDPAHNMQVPGKTFQYLSRGKPILGVMLECETADIIRRSGLGLVAPPDDTRGIARHIVHFWQNREHLPSVFSPDWEYISEFSRARMAERVNGLLESLLQ